MKIKKRLKKSCAVCGRKMKVIIYPDRSYRGGHFFGKVPLYTDAEMAKAIAAGTRPYNSGSSTWQVLKKDPKPYDHAEYWECPKCYWGKK